MELSNSWKAMRYTAICPFTDCPIGEKNKEGTMVEGQVGNGSASFVECQCGALYTPVLRTHFAIKTTLARLLGATSEFDVEFKYAPITFGNTTYSCTRSLLFGKRIR